MLSTEEEFAKHWQPDHGDKPGGGSVEPKQQFFLRCGLLKDEDKFMGFIHAKNRWVAQGAKMVVFLPAIPDY